MPGYYEIVGQDEDLDDLSLVESLLGEDYLLGRSPMRSFGARGARGMRRGGGRAVPRPSQQAVANAIAVKQAEGGVLVRESAPSKGEETAMGLATAAAIAAAAAGTATGTPQKLFRPTRFTVPASIAPSFVLTALNIGVTNQLASIDAIPCECLQESAVGSGLKLETAQINNNVSANITNIGLVALIFRACIFGTAAK